MVFNFLKNLLLLWEDGSGMWRSVDNFVELVLLVHLTQIARFARQEPLLKGISQVQWFSAFVMLRPSNTAPCDVATSSYKIIFVATP